MFVTTAVGPGEPNTEDLLYVEPESLEDHRDFNVSTLRDVLRR